MTIEISNRGNIYWVDDADFPTSSYKNLLISGLLGTIKVVLSPSGDLLAIGGS